MNKSILQYWQRLQQRARILLISEAFLRFVILFGMLILGAAIGFSAQASYEMVWYSALIVLAVWTVKQVWTFSKQWAMWSGVHQIAERVEKSIPALGERTYLALDTTSERSFLRERALNKAAHILSQVPIHQLVTADGTKRLVKQMCFTLILLGVAEWRLPVSPTQALNSLTSKTAHVLSKAEDATVDETEMITIGDIVIEYSFPEYTGMTPVKIPNSNGEIHAPQGTHVQLSAKTLERFEAVQLSINGETHPATLNFGREVTAVFDVLEEGEYRFLFFDGQQNVPSQSFPLVFDDDDPPVVSLEIKRTDIPSNRPISMTWNATDDFGLERVVLEVESNGRTKEVILRKPNENTLKLGARIKRSVAELGLNGGDTAILRVVAYDNQAPIGEAVSPEEGQPFGKRGESAPVEIQILTPQMSADQMRELNLRLRDALVFILADYLVETVPTERRVFAWSNQAMRRYDPLRKITDEAWGEGWPTYLSAELIAEIYSDSASLFRFVRTTYSSESIVTPKSEDIEYFTESYTEHISQLEHTIYIIDRMLQKVALRDVNTQAKKLERAAEKFSRLKFDEKSKQELLNALTKIDRDLQSIDEAVEELGDYYIKDYVEDRYIELSRMQDVIQEQIASSDSEAEAVAQEYTDQFAQAVSQFSEDVTEILERMKAKEDELEQEMESLIEKLEALDEKQQAKLSQLQQTRQEDPFASEIADLWTKIEAQAIIAADASSRLMNNLGDGRGFRYGTMRSIERLQNEMVGLKGATITRNFETVERIVLTSGIRLKRVENVLENELFRSRPPSDPLPNSVMQMKQDNQIVAQALVELQKLLGSSALSNAESNPYLMEAAQAMEEEQRILQQEMMGLIPKVQELEQQIPTANGDATEFAMEAGRSMEQAADFLGAGDNMAGESLQFQSSARIQDTIDALKQAAAQMQQMQEQTDQMAGGGEGDTESMSSEVELPPIEPRVSPEEYRKMLLQGMQGGVPEEYETLKKKYYEELVAQ